MLVIQQALLLHSAGVWVEPVDRSLVVAQAVENQIVRALRAFLPAEQRFRQAD